MEGIIYIHIYIFTILYQATLVLCELASLPPPLPQPLSLSLSLSLDFPEFFLVLRLSCYPEMKVSGTILTSLLFVLCSGYPDIERLEARAKTKKLRSVRNTNLHQPWPDGGGSSFGRLQIYICICIYMYTFCWADIP